MATAFDILIVGAGQNGLVAAGYLARQGLRVLVLERRSVVGGACVTEEVFPGCKVSTAACLKNAILHRHILTPADLEAEYGMTGGNIFHGEMSLDQLFFLRPLAGWARYRTPIRNLYLCGSGHTQGAASRGRRAGTRHGRSSRTGAGDGCADAL